MFALPFLLLTMTLTPVQIAQCIPACGKGQWSAHAISVPDDFRVPSPDGHVTITGNRDFWWLATQGKVASARHEVLSWTEFLWAPDSHAFAVTESVGYTSGYHVRVFVNKSRDWTEVKGLTTRVGHDFERKHQCYYHSVNVAAVSWQQGSNELILAAVEPETGDCPHTCYFETYLLDVNKKRIADRRAPSGLPPEWKAELGENLAGDYECLQKSKRERSFVLSLQSRRESTL